MIKADINSLKTYLKYKLYEEIKIIVIKINFP